MRAWFFEVWNEPNLPFFWAGTKEEYFKLYEAAARAIKSVDSRLRVGGPATSVNAWIPEMIAFCQRSGAPLDFISTHHYPTDDPLWRNQSLSWEDFMKVAGQYQRGVLFEMTAKARLEAGKLPLYYTEWNTSAMVPDPLHDEPFSAAMIAKTIADAAGWWTGILSGPSRFVREGGSTPRRSTAALACRPSTASASRTTACSSFYTRSATSA